MLCPQCGYNGDLIEGGCAHCGYGRMHTRQVLLPKTQTSYALSTTPVYTFSRGDTLSKGRYRLSEQIALPENQRSQARAWLASDNQTPQRRVVVRELLQSYTLQTADEEMVRSAALQLNGLAKNTRGIPQILDIFHEQGFQFIIIEYTEGSSLAFLIQQQGGALPEPIVAEYGRQLCQLLSALSTQSIVHGNISPSTIIVSPDSAYVSLVHFPILMPLVAPLSSSKASSSSGYLAPEQLRGTLGPSSDLYSLAATLHYAVTGYDPAERMSFFHPPARRLNPAVTPQMEAILAKELRLSNAQRYPDATAMQKDLEALIASYPHNEAYTYSPQESNKPQQISPMKMRDSNSNLLDIGVFAAIAVLLLIGLMFFLLR